MISSTDLRAGTHVELDGQPWRVLEYQHIKVARGGATVKVKMMNVLTGSTVIKSFSSGEKLQPADIGKYAAQFLFKDGEDFTFMDNNSYEQFSIKATLLGVGAKFIQDNMEVQVEYYNQIPIGVTLPITVNLKVVQAQDVTKGDTSGSVTKEAEVETGAMVQVPAFVKVGDVIKIDTRSGEYLERV